MSLDYTQKLSINIESERIDVHTIPEKLRNTHRFLLKFIGMAPYNVDHDLTFTLYYKQLNTDQEFFLSYTVSHTENRFKRKLPLGINCREWRIAVTGSDLTIAEIGEIEVLWTPRRIGDR